MIKNNFFIITGGPGVGKTTLINRLNQHGFQIIQEDARRIIKNQMETNNDGLPWKNKELYAELMLEASIKSYNDTIIEEKSNDITFFDRGIIDTICYMKLEDIPISEQIINLTKNYSYNKNVFILPPWKEIYETDNERKQDWKEAKFTYQKMYETYTEFGYNLIDLPKLEIEERVNFIIENLDKFY